MAIKISGTTVIDDSRNLTNINSGAVLGIQSAGNAVGAGATTLNFIGAGNTFSYNAGTKTLDISIQGGGGGGGEVSISTNTSNQNQYIPYATSFGSTTEFGATSNFVFNPYNTRLGIKTTTPQRTLHVNGDFLVSAGAAVTNHIIQRAYEDNNGTISWESNSGQLVSFSNNLTSGSIFNVTNTSGIPYIDVDADGTIDLSPYDNGNVNVGGGVTDGGITLYPTTGIVSATSFYGDGSNLTDIVTSIGGDGEDFNANLTTSTYHSVGSNLTAFTGIGISFPSTAGKTYLIESIHVANIVSSDLYVTARLDYNGSQNVQLANKIIVPYQGALELLEESIVANPSDVIRFAGFTGIGTDAAGYANGLDCYITYETKEDSDYIGTGVTVTSVGIVTAFTSTTNPSVVNTIMLTNYSDSVDVDASVSIFRGGTLRQGYLVKSLTVPQNSSVQILPKAKRLNASDAIVVEATSANVLSVNVAGKYIV